MNIYLVRREGENPFSDKDYYYVFNTPYIIGDMMGFGSTRSGAIIHWAKGFFNPGFALTHIRRRLAP